MLIKYLIIFFVSMVPIVELRGAIPIAVGWGLDLLPSYIISVLGNMVPVPFIYLFARKILVWGADQPYIGKFFNWCLDKGERGGQKLAGNRRPRSFCRSASVRRYSTSRNRSLDRYPGCQFSGYEIQAGSPCLHGRRAFGRHHHGTDQYRRIQRPGCSVLT